MTLENYRTTSQRARIVSEGFPYFPRHPFRQPFLRLFCLNVEKTLASVFGKRRKSVGELLVDIGSCSRQIRYVLKAAGFALTSSIARTNRSQRSRELSGRMTGGGLISGHESLVTSSNLGRNS